ncbi:MAG TPA: SpoIIE family protein phosphatase [Acidimicrobiales bacterium]|nr:SpoIIE family protein phosphatase [Acidimicrobiales bacterium]
MSDEPDLAEDPAPDDALGQLSTVKIEEVLDGLPHAVVVADQGSRIVYINGGAERLLGWGRQDLIGQPLAVIIPERLREAHFSGMARYLLTRESRIIGERPIRVAARARDGKEIEIELSLSAHRLETGHDMFVGSLRDLSDRVALEHQRALTRYIELTRDITGHVGLIEDAQGLEAAARLVLQAIGETLQWDFGVAWVVKGDCLCPLDSWRREGEGRVVEQLGGSSLRLVRGEGLPGRVWATGEPAWIHDVALDPNFPRHTAAVEQGLHTAVAFPIVAHGDLACVVEFFAREHQLPEWELMAAMSTAGEHIGRLIERAEARREATAARDRATTMARALQASLLPPRAPVIPGLEVAARYHAATGGGEVGGDFYDVFATAPGRWAVVIGDVEGRGPQAAAMSALARYTVRGAAAEDPPAIQVLQTLNEVLLAEQPPDDIDWPRFLTAAYCCMEMRHGELFATAACGGHPLPLIISPRDGLRELPCRGSLLGVFADADFAETEVRLRPGEAAVLVTDGVFEGRSGGEIFGEERLHESLLTAAGKDADGIASTIEEAVLAFLDGESQDDIAIVVVRVPDR